jgi:hypothetical protein
MFRFGVFTLDLERGELQKNGRTLRLQPRPTKLLVLLVSHAGRVVTREEIQAALWDGDTFVDYDQSAQDRRAMGRLSPAAERANDLQPDRGLHGRRHPARLFSRRRVGRVPLRA